MRGAARGVRCLGFRGRQSNGQSLCVDRTRERAIRHLEMLSAHLSPVIGLPGLAPTDALLRLPATVAEPMTVFLLEDFFTTRFGTDGEINVVDAYLNHRGRRESATARVYPEALRDSAVSVHEVVDVDRGQSVMVRNRHRGREPVAVEEKLGSMGVALHGHLAARVVVAGGRRFFTGVLLPFRRELSLPLQSAFEEMAADLDHTVRENTVTNKSTDRDAGAGVGSDVTVADIPAGGDPVVACRCRGRIRAAVSEQSGISRIAPPRSSGQR